MTLKLFLTLTLLSSMTGRNGVTIEIRELNDSTRVEMVYQKDSVIWFRQWKYEKEKEKKVK